MSDAWYRDGLSFECTGCGRCCTGSPGYVWILPEEMDEMARYLGISTQGFVRRYSRWVDDRQSLTERAPGFDCVFLTRDRGCLVYPARPLQCRTYPWWPENLVSPGSWQQAARACEGIRDHAPIVPGDRIKEELAASRGRLRRGERRIDEWKPRATPRSEGY